MCWILISFETMGVKTFFSSWNKFAVINVINITIHVWYPWLLFDVYSNALCLVIHIHHCIILFYFLFIIHLLLLCYILLQYISEERKTLSAFSIKIFELVLLFVFKDSSLDVRCYWKTPSLMILLKDNLATCYNQLLKFIVTVLNIVHWLWHWRSTN